MFSESEFPVNISVLDTRHVQFESRNTNLFYLFNDQLDYAQAHNFAESETTRCNDDKYLSNLQMKPITKKLSYCNVDKRIEKLSTIPQGLLDNKQTENKFKLESDVNKIVEQNLTIES